MPMSGQPKVLIVGAGLGGITLGILLEKAGVPYEIYEQASIIKPIGSAISLTAGVLPMMRQIGIYDDVLKNSKIATCSKLYNDKRQEFTTVDWSFAKDLTGYDTYIIARPIFYSMLLRQIPLHKIHYGRKVLGIQQNDSGVTIFCSDNRSYFGNILIGADGASSTVRKCMFAQMKSKDLLPLADEAEMRYTCECLVGQTRPLDTHDFPELKQETCVLNTIVGCDGPYKWTTMTTGYSICWMVLHFFDKENKDPKDKEKDKEKGKDSRNSNGYQRSNRSSDYTEWGPEAIDAICNDVRHFEVPGGNGKLKIGDLIDQTSKGFIVKGMLAERVFEAWHHGRTVLLGDACHPMDPYGGQGAVNSMQDAIALANWINVLPSRSMRDVGTIFEEYTAERQAFARKSLQATRLISMMNEKGLAGAFSRFAAKTTPTWLRRYMVRKISTSRPQVSFLPFVPDHGEMPAIQHPSYYKTKPLAEKKAALQTY
ncbi:hypothetical protein BGZ94_003762 [Podila epigama]|nr:hypothetical protein BGZ94_003762 [Podila epigama]